MTDWHAAPTSLEYLRKQAKALRKSLIAGEPAAVARLRLHHPRSIDAASARLSDAQLVVARENGFTSWPGFVRHLQRAAAETPEAAVWNAAIQAVRDAEAPTLDRLLAEHPDLLRHRTPPSDPSGGLAPDFSTGDACTILLREHQFEDWTEFRRFRESVTQTDSVAGRFELAADATIEGHADALRRLLRANPALIQARSLRRHHSTLLHYVGANGVEYFRQRTPSNAVEIATILLEAGADVNAIADLYGGATTLGLVATSVFPARAGVQAALIDLLIANGAAIDAPAAAGNGHSAVNGCLANGRRAAAEYLAARGAHLDLEGAAGVGRLDVVRSFFDVAGRLTNGPTEDQLRSGFQWACEYGRVAVARFLLECGVPVNELHRGRTGLHWAAFAGDAEMVRLLLDHGASPAIRDERFGGTPLGWALHGWGDPPPDTSPDQYYEVVSLLVDAGTPFDPSHLPGPTRNDPRMAVALRLT